MVWFFFAIHFPAFRFTRCRFNRGYGVFFLDKSQNFQLNFHLIEKLCGTTFRASVF